MTRLWTICLLGASATAYAEDRSFHLTLAGDVSATDNVFATDSESRQGDVYGQLRPGLLFGWATPRSTYEGLLEGEFLDYANHSDKPSITYRATTRASWVTGPFSELSFGLGGSTGRLNALSTRVSPDQTQVVITPPGEVKVTQADANQGFGYQVSQTVHFSQSLGGRFSKSEEPSQAEVTSAEASAGLGLEKGFEDNAVGFNGGASVTRLLRYQPPVDMVPMSGRLDKSVNPRAELSWKHDISRNWSTVLAGGIAMVIPFGDDPYNPTLEKRGTTSAPLFNGTVAYTDTWGFANLSASHTIQPNLLIAQNTINSSASLLVSIPLVWLEENRGRPPKWIAAGNLGFSRSELVRSTDAETDGVFYVGRLDAGVSYALRPNTTFAFRYALQHQQGDSSATMAIPSFTTNTFTFTFQVRYPDTRPVVVKKTKSQRADRSDINPIEESLNSDDAKGVGGNVAPPGGNE